MRLFGKDKGPPSAELLFFSRYSILADGCLGGSGKLWRSINRLPTIRTESARQIDHSGTGACGFAASESRNMRLCFSKTSSTFVGSSAQGHTETPFGGKGEIPPKAESS